METVTKEVVAIPAGNLRVSWYVDMEKAGLCPPKVDEHAAAQAAGLARRMIVDPTSIATFYEVEDEDGTLFHVELEPRGKSVHTILDDVLEAMQAAEEMGGPEGSDYVLLMAAIAAEANKRIHNYHAARKQES